VQTYDGLNRELYRLSTEHNSDILITKMLLRTV